MDVDFSTVFITQNKIPRPGFLQLYISVSLLLQPLAQPRNVFLLNRNVQVLVRAGLLAKERVNAPPTINPNFDLQVFQFGIEADYVRGSHMTYDLIWRRLAPVLFVTNLFHPVNGLAVELFLNGDVRHGCGRRGAVPVLLAG